MALQQVKSSRIAAPNLRQKLHATFAISQTFANGLANYIILMLIFCLSIATGWSRSRKVPTSERSLKSRVILARSVGGFIPDQAVRLAPVVEKTIASGSNVGSSWRISSLFGGWDNRPSIEDYFISKQFSDPVQSMDHAFSMIHLRKALSAVNQTKRDLRNVVHQETLQRKPPRRDVATRFTKLSEKVLRYWRSYHLMLRQLKGL